MLVNSVAASSFGSIVIPFTPQYVGILPGAAGTITLLQCKTLGIGVTCDLDANGLLYMGRPRVQGTFLGASRMFLIPMADGLLKDRTCQVDLTTGAGGTVSVYAIAMREGKYPYITGRQTVLANTAYTVDKFFQTASDTTSTDNLTLISNPSLRNKDGQLIESAIVHQIQPAELKALAVLFSNFSNGVDWDVALLDNWNQNFKSITYTPIAQRTVYFTKMASL